MKNNLAQLRQKNLKELRTDVGKKKTDLAKEFAESRASKKRDFKKPRLLKLEIARILTIIRENELTGGDKDEPKPTQKVLKKTDKKIEIKPK